MILLKSGGFLAGKRTLAGEQIRYLATLLKVTAGHGFDMEGRIYW